MSIKKKYGTKELEKDFGPLTFGKLLSSHRLGEEWTQDEMAKKLGITKQSLCDLEKGRRIPSPSRAASIAKKLQMHEASFIEIALQDQLNHDKINLVVTVNTTKAKLVAGRGFEPLTFGL